MASAREAPRKRFLGAIFNLIDAPIPHGHVPTCSFRVIGADLAKRRCLRFVFLCVHRFTVQLSPATVPNIKMREQQVNCLQGARVRIREIYPGGGEGHISPKTISFVQLHGNNARRSRDHKLLNLGSKLRNDSWQKRFPAEMVAWDMIVVHWDKEM